MHRGRYVGSSRFYRGGFGLPDGFITWHENANLRLFECGGLERMNKRDFKFYLQWLSIRLWPVTGLAVRPQSRTVMVEVPLLTWLGADAYVVTWKSLFKEPITSMV
jgi:hypothetical protein